MKVERGHDGTFGIKCVSRVKKDTIGVICSCNNGMGCRVPHHIIPSEAQTMRRVCAVGEDAHPTSEWKIGNKPQRQKISKTIVIHSKLIDR